MKERPDQSDRRLLPSLRISPVDGERRLYRCISKSLIEPLIHTIGRCFLEAHCLRLRPRCDGQQNLTYFDLKVVPAPLGSSDGIDLDGNVTVEYLVRRFDGEVSR